MPNFLEREANLYWRAARALRAARRLGLRGADFVEDLGDLACHVEHPVICTDIGRLLPTHAEVEREVVAG